MAESTKVCLYNSHGDSFLKALLVVVASRLRRLAACMHPKILTPEISICSRCPVAMAVRDATITRKTQSNANGKHRGSVTVGVSETKRNTQFD